MTTATATTTAASPVDEARQAELSGAVSQLIDTYNEWESDPAVSYPSEALETAIKLTAATAASGSIPASCRHLINAIETLAEEWDAYETHQKIQSNGHPLESLWRAYESLVSEFSGVIMPQPVQRETVSQLIDQGLTYEQVAKAFGKTIEVHGRLRWEGVFFGPNQIPNIAAIRQQDAYERATPADRETQSLVPFIPADWVHPDDANQAAELAEQHTGRLQRIQSQRAKQGDRDPASITELLTEGQYPDVIAKVKGTTEEDVRRIAAEESIEVNERPNVAAIDFKAIPPDTAPNVDEPIAPPVDATAPVEDTGDEDGDVTDIDDAETPSDEDINARIIEIAASNPDADSPTIAKLAEENLGVPVNGRKVGQVLRRNKAK